MTNQKIKTILYVHANNTDIGGADYCLYKLAAELDKKKFRPIVCLSQKTKIIDLYRKEGIKTYVIDMERIKKKFNPIYLSKLIYKFLPTVNTIREIIKKEHVDLIHGNDLLDVYGPVAGIIENKPTAQYVRWILESPKLLKMIITSLVYRLNDRVLTVSDGVYRNMFSKNGRLLSKISTCYDWIDMEKVGHGQKGSDVRMEYGIPDDAALVGCVGRLDYWKGQEIFIRAASKILTKKPDTRFLVIGGAVAGRGREQYGNSLKKLVVQLGIDKQVIFTGHRSDISNIMRSLDIAVHSSITPDPLPGVVMEAMSCSRPVVGANAGGVPEEIENGKTGLLYEPGNFKQMAEKIIQLLESPDVSKQMGIAGRNRVEKVFEKKALCERIQTIYKQMIDERYQVSGNKNKETVVGMSPTKTYREIVS